MPIYTKTGDRGTTSLYGGKRLLKSDLQVEAYGSVDELSSLIGLVISKNKKIKKFLTEVQKDLYQIMGSLGGAKVDLVFIEKRVLYFEKEIDQLTEKLPKISNFILPQGSELSCWFHILRTVCRRTERNVVVLLKNKHSRIYDLKSIIQYLNRLSDLFFVLSRHYNNQKEVIIIK